ncbi:MAG: BrnT family toxin [Alphaproteobacteria bacterium]|nr:BrnT family toxin [Alphaproteobacteria bacterium]
MDIEIIFDPNKDRRNIDKHGISLSSIVDIDWPLAVTREDDRVDYGEHRYRIFAPLDGILHTAVVVWRKGTMRGISLRQANKKERKWYEEEIG